jgi:hypothetical protein
VRSSNGNWNQQGTKLLASDNSGTSVQGTAVSLSGDGNTALIGGPNDNSSIGAAWIFVRSSNGSWNQSVPKLVGTDHSGPSQFGTSVSLSTDGSTALIGGKADNFNVGAAWIFVQSNGSWNQQGPKLTVSDGSNFGKSVSLNINGNIAVIGNPLANSNAGEFYVFVRSNQSWSQYGSALAATGLTVNSQLGTAIAIAESNSVTVVGASVNNTDQGTFVVFS